MVKLSDVVDIGILVDLFVGDIYSKTGGLLDCDMICILPFVIVIGIYPKLFVTPTLFSFIDEVPAVDLAVNEIVTNVPLEETLPDPSITL
jgi:hypothetical protein